MRGGIVGATIHSAASLSNGLGVRQQSDWPTIGVVAERIIGNTQVKTTVNTEWKELKALLERTLAKTTWFQEPPMPTK